MKKQYIISDPNILAGMPVIIGSRVPIARILFLLKEGYTVNAIHEEFPHVSLENIEGAINELIERFGSNTYASQVS
jgi:uncharacterized protein (DUF433 family)